ncbi:hypothetical protein RvY_07002-2 [Ramazzottius varieornatus]|uniref:Peptidase M13 C-terminal domain-containing protein n=1 Tax=Ramazzottius varieornatus TaxID=947166 RepID=A0A1D1V961_RAMVA|nr:hypothetical protein RvY_07002-2 [Ramazzottius varieornatus]
MMAQRHFDLKQWLVILSGFFAVQPLCEAQRTDIGVSTPVPLNLSTTVVSVPGNSTPVEVCTTEGCIAIADQILSGMNFSADPCDDFFAFACDNYIAKHPLGNRKQFNVIGELRAQAEQQVTDMMEPNANDTMTLSDAELKAKRIYAQCLAKKPDVEPLLRFMNAIMLSGWPMLKPSWDSSSFNLYNVLLNMSSFGVQPFFITELVQDVGDPTHNLITFGQPTTFASKDTLQSDIGQQVTVSYFEYVVGATRLLLKQSGVNRSVSAVMNDAMDIVDLEIDLAMAGLGDVEQRDITMLKDKMSLGMFQNNFLNQSSFFRQFTSFTRDLFTLAILSNEIDRNTTVVPMTAEVFRRIDGLLASLESLGDVGRRRIANYVGWQLVNANLAYLTKDFAIVRQEYLSKIGMSASDPKDDTAAVECGKSLRQVMPLAVASIYVRNFVPPDLQPKAAMMITDVKAGFGQMLRTANWMDDATTTTALQKLQNMLVFAANSKEITDNATALNREYSEVKIGDTFLDTMQIIIRLKVTKNLRKLTQMNVRPDPYNDAYDITTVNAYNEPIENQIVILAAILQSPFYDSQVPQYMNYGGIGFVIGHEISHGFDDQGSRFDANQLLRDWWTDTTRELYDNKKGGFVKQYSSFCTEEVGCLNGRLTLGENIADNGGIKAAYKAYFDFFKLRVKGEPEVSLPGFTDFSPEQMFFLSAGHLWCGSTSLEKAQLLLLTDPHSSARFRVNGPLSNSPEFGQAYKCPLGSKMNPTQKFSVW